MPSQACLLARAKLAQHVAKLRESATAEKVGTAIKAGYLASAKTVLRNDLGNATFGGMEYLVGRPLAVALDNVIAHVKSAATFGEIKPYEYRQMANTVSFGGLARGAKGIRDGVARATQLLKTNIDPEEMANKYVVDRTTYNSSAWDTAVHRVFNMLEANDKPFWHFAYETSLYGRAKLLAIREGLKGDALAARTNELLNTPTDEMHLGALDDAQYATFKNETVIGRGLGKLRQGLSTHPIGKVAASINIPFTHVASAMTMAGVDYSPLGFLRLAWDAVGSDPAMRGVILRRDLGRLGAGAGLFALGYGLARIGRISGDYPTSPNQRSQNDLENQPANSIRIGGRWLDYRWLGPLSIAIAMGSAYEQHGAGAALAAPLTEGIKAVTELSVLTGLSRFIEALQDPAHKGSSLVASQIPVPPLLGQIAQAIDPVSRVSHSVPQRIEARLPFVSKRLPARITQFGDTLRKPGGPLLPFVDITNSRPSTATDVTREMDRLGVRINNFGSTIRVLGQGSVRRTPEEYNAILKAFGPLKRRALERLIASPAYRAASDDDKQKAIEIVLRQVQSIGNTVDKARRLGRSFPQLGLPAIAPEGR